MAEQGHTCGTDELNPDCQGDGKDDDNAVVRRDADRSELRQGDTAALSTGDVCPGVLQRYVCAQEGGGGTEYRGRGARL